MITTNKDITYFLDEKGIGYNPVRMMILLGKLDHEDLEDLLNPMQDQYEAGENSSSRYSQSELNKQYDEGYNAGVNSVLKKYGSD